MEEAIGPGWCQARCARLLHAISLGVRYVRIECRSGIARLFGISRRKPWGERPTFERVYGSQSVSCLDQLRKFVCGVFNLTKYFFRIFFGVGYDDGNRVVLGRELVMSICKVTNDLPK
jgi:hypothetical protein